MGTSWTEKLSITRQKVIKELVEGQQSATQLKTLLHKTIEDHGSVSAEQLVLKILRSFTETISVLSSFESTEVTQNLAVSHADSHCDDRRSEDSGETSRKRPASKDRRGCYRRRKTSHTWTAVSHTIDDGQAWRKYGQKEILNAKHPRSYFRCTRKYDQGCRATKQVQRMEDNPDMYQTTYIGNHTCRDMLKVPQIITESHANRDTLLLNSGSTFPIGKQDHAISSSTPAIKQESKEEALSDLTDNLSSLGGTNLWSDLKDFEVSTMYSCTDIDFEGDFNFDATEYL